jgi:hypothetical protein
MPDYEQALRMIGELIESQTKLEESSGTYRSDMALAEHTAYRKIARIVRQTLHPDEC